MTFKKVLAVLYALLGLSLLIFSVPYRLETGHEFRALIEFVLAVGIIVLAWVRWRNSASRNR